MAYHHALACISPPKKHIINRWLYSFRNDIDVYPQHKKLLLKFDELLDKYLPEEVFYVVDKHLYRCGSQ